MQAELTLEDLVNQSGLSTRTIRFYIQEGLLPGPDSRGKFANYSQEHLDRLEIIKHLKKMHLPLHEIRRLLNRMTPREVDRFLQQTDIPEPQTFTEKKSAKLPESTAGAKALAYIQSLTQARENIPHLSEPQARYPSSPRWTGTDQPSQIHSEAETWRRIVLREGFELHIRDDVGSQQEINKLIETIRQLFDNESK